jgi:hypothetical protein
MDLIILVFLGSICLSTALQKLNITTPLSPSVQFRHCLMLG